MKGMKSFEKPAEIVGWYIRQKGKIVVTFLVLGVFFAIASAFVPINYNLIDYLPQETQSTKGLAVMEEEFSQGVPNGSVMLPPGTIQEALEAKKQLQSIDTIEQIIWLDDFEDPDLPLSVMDPALKENYMKESRAKLSIVVSQGKESETLKAIYEIMGSEVAVTGDFVIKAEHQEKAIGESIKAFIVLIPIILLILFLTTTSWLEPVLYVLTISIAVLLNWGSNVFLGDVSFVTLAASPILQLAVSMDYAIFLLHRYEDYKAVESDKNLAMKQAVLKSFPVIAASASTTFLGFAVLLLMRFEIGADLGLNLVKGIVFSFITVILLLPCLTLLLDPLLEKFRHKNLLPSFHGVGKKILAVRYLVFFLVLIAIVPSFLGQNNNTFLYGVGENILPQSRQGQDAREVEVIYGKEVFITLLIPKGQKDKELELEKDLAELDYVEEILSYERSIGQGIPEYFLPQEVVDVFRSPNYSRMMLITSTKEESPAAFRLVQEVEETGQKYYDRDLWIVGESVSLHDIKEVVTKDRKLVAGMAVLAIGLVIVFAFRSFLLPLILLLTIETSIWINLSIPYFLDHQLNFIGFLIITAVQLGVTVDYAILLTHHYQDHRSTMLPREAMGKTLGETFLSILVSATMLTMAGGSLWLVSSDPMVSELGLLLGRGALLSVTLVIFFLPTLLLLLDRWIIRERKIIRRA